MVHSMKIYGERFNSIAAVARRQGRNEKLDMKLELDTIQF
jgi:hypothetical protein